MDFLICWKGSGGTILILVIQDHNDNIAYLWRYGHSRSRAGTRPPASGREGERRPSGAKLLLSLSPSFLFSFGRGRAGRAGDSFVGEKVNNLCRHRITERGRGKAAWRGRQRPADDGRQGNMWGSLLLPSWRLFSRSKVFSHELVGNPWWECYVEKFLTQ